MTFQPCPETAEIRLQGTLNGQVVENVFHARIPTLPDTTDLEAIRDVVNDWATGDYSVTLSNSLTWTQLVITDLNTEGGVQVLKDMSAEGGGDVDNPVKTNQDTFAVKLGTARAGRSFRGRFYWLALHSGTYSTPNTITPTAQAALVSAAQALIDNLATAGYPLGVLSRYSGVDANHKPIKRAAGLLTDVVTASASNNVVDTQRRRMPGHGI